MIVTKVDDRDFMNKMNNVIQYGFGFMEGAEKGKLSLLENLGNKMIIVIGEYVDASARVNPSRLHHVYEWDQAGSEGARLFDIDKTVTSSRLRFTYNFRQSSSMRSGSTVPFYNKAEVMESGEPVIVSPKRATVLRFEIDGEEVFTSKPVRIANPGGQEVEGGFRMTINNFFQQYSQSVLTATGIARDLKNLKIFVSGMRTGGRSFGRTQGYQWISSAGGIA